MSGTPISHWIGFHLCVFALLALELIYVRWQGPGRVRSSSVAATVMWVGAALAFGLFILHTLGGDAATQYLAGYAVEESLSIDNLFVFLLLFGLFKIDPARQPKVLFWGVGGAIVLRGAFIAAGLGLLDHFHWISYLFGAVLLAAAIRLILPRKPEEETHTPRWLQWLSRLQPVSLRQDSFFVRENGRRMMTVLMLSLIAIEITDVIFALDSIPAVLSITREPFLAYTSNIMAVMGLRSLYFLLAHLLATLRFLHYGLSAVLAFAAVKMIGAPWLTVSPMLSLLIIFAILAVTILASLWPRLGRDNPDTSHSGE